MASLLDGYPKPLNPDEYGVNRLAASSYNYTEPAPQLPQASGELPPVTPQVAIGPPPPKTPTLFEQMSAKPISTASMPQQQSTLQDIYGPAGQQSYQGATVNGPTTVNPNDVSNIYGAAINVLRGGSRMKDYSKM